jgi:dTDP-4-dehydrorhamnose reductase
MNILITGGSGFLGWNLTKELHRLGRILATYKDHKPRLDGCSFVQLDVADKNSVDNLLAAARPDVVIHTAGLKDVAYCQTHEQLAYQANVEGTKRLAQMVSSYDALLIYISTDLVFDGAKGFYAENDLPNPLSYYAQTKLLAEESVRNHSSRYIVLRTALMYGIGNQYHGCFINWMKENLRRGLPIPLFTDQYRTPFYVGDAVAAISELIGNHVENRLFHLGGNERFNRYEFGKKYAKIFGCDEGLLNGRQMSEMEGFSVYGRDCSLDSRRLKSLLPGLTLSNVEEGLKRMQSEDDSL